MQNNPLYNMAHLPQFKEIKAEHILPAIRQHMNDINEKLTLLLQINNVTWKNFGAEYCNLFNRLNKAYSIFHIFLETKNTNELRQIAEIIDREVVEFSLNIAQNKTLYNMFKILKDNNYHKLTSSQQRVIDLYMQEAELSGVNLDGEKKDKFMHLSKKYSELSFKFSNNVLDSTKANAIVVTDKNELNGLTNNWKTLSSKIYNSQTENTNKHGNADNGPWLITLNGSLFIDFMQYAENRSLRQKMLELSLNIATENELNNNILINEILNIRKEMANILGFNNYAEMSISKKMAPSLTEVLKLYDDLKIQTTKATQQEYEELANFVKESGMREEFKAWDIFYYRRQLKEKKFNINYEQLKEYFPLPVVLNGMFNLASDLFGIKIIEETDKVQLWDKDVKYYKVYNEKNEYIADFYSDLYARLGEKRAGAWANNLSNRTENSCPIIYIACNFAKSSDNIPTLLDLNTEVSTLFHEFGHALQGLLTTVNEIPVSGLNGIEWDAIEIASQMFEKWIYDKNVINQISSHFKTKEPLNNTIINAILDENKFGKATNIRRQILLGKSDLLLHSVYSENINNNHHQIVTNLQNELILMPKIDKNQFLCSFSHIFASTEYAGGYYSYIWADILSSDIYVLFKNLNIEERNKLGKKLRDTLLSLGGSEHPLVVFEKFVGRTPTIDAYIKENGW